MKFLPYSHQSITAADILRVVKVLSSDWITQGPAIKVFEQDLCSYSGAKYAVAVANGTAALHLACLAAGIGPGDEVIVPPISFLATANCALYCGARPVFCDIEPETININPALIKEKISSRTRAIIPVHFAGHPCVMDKIRALAAEHGLTVIEDAAHALGAEYKGKKTGSCAYSDMTILSFHPVKSITTGEGGALLTNSRDLYEKLLCLRTHGVIKNRDNFVFPDSEFQGPWYYEMQDLGFNFRITDFQAALGSGQIKKLDRFIEKRRVLVRYYNKAFSSFPGLTLPEEKAGIKSAWHLYYLRVENPQIRKKLFLKLREEKIGAQVHYIPIHLQPYYREKLEYQPGDFPVAEDYAGRTISLPLFPQMKIKDAARVVRSVKKILSE